MNLGVSHASHPKRAEFQGYPISGVRSPVFMSTPFITERPKIGERLGPVGPSPCSNGVPDPLPSPPVLSCRIWSFSVKWYTSVKEIRLNNLISPVPPFKITEGRPNRHRSISHPLTFRGVASDRGILVYLVIYPKISLP